MNDEGFSEAAVREDERARTEARMMAEQMLRSAMLDRRGIPQDRINSLFSAASAIREILEPYQTISCPNT